MRLDKYLANMGVGTRSEVKGLIRQRRILVNGEQPKGPERKIDENSDIITFDGQQVNFVKMEYIMFHKPQGVITATEDRNDKTVMDFIESPIKKQLFPVGRLDKDTEGLLLITNDGDLAHRLLSPKKHVSKVYYAKIEGFVEEKDVEIFREGVKIEEDFTALPAELTILEQGEISEIKVEIYEGKFHQVKRMFEAVGKKVIYLKRLSMGSLVLDEALPLGEYRPLTEDEVQKLQSLGK